MDIKISFRPKSRFAVSKGCSTATSPAFLGRGKTDESAIEAQPRRLPEDFCFQLTKEEISRSQFATSSSRGGRRYLPYVYTEQGIIALAVSPRHSSVTGVSRTSRKIRAISG
ncbi:MAG: ORF6N domain-containing protein [Candidatus Enteromonas sp.]|nr:ORF6N domain-containing protein [Candidatus Enteromonas sp.]